MKKLEIWKDIIGYEGIYQISNQGRVKSLKFEKEKILKPINNGCGYLRVNLCKNEKQNGYLVHRLVAQTFLPNPNDLLEINHRDENKTNNSIENLEWCSAKYNINYGTHNQRMSETKLKPVLQFDKYGNFIREWKSARDIHRILGYSFKNISANCLGKRNSCCGFVWRYKK